MKFLSILGLIVCCLVYLLVWLLAASAGAWQPFIALGAGFVAGRVAMWLGSWIWR